MPTKEKQRRNPLLPFKKRIMKKVCEVPAIQGREIENDNGMLWAAEVSDLYAEMTKKKISLEEDDMIMEEVLDDQVGCLRLWQIYSPLKYDSWCCRIQEWLAWKKLPANQRYSNSVDQFKESIPISHCYSQHQQVIGLWIPTYWREAWTIAMFGFTDPVRAYTTVEDAITSSVVPTGTTGLYSSTLLYCWFIPGKISKTTLPLADYGTVLRPPDGDTEYWSWLSRKDSELLILDPDRCLLPQYICLQKPSPRDQGDTEDIAELALKEAKMWSAVSTWMITTDSEHEKHRPLSLPTDSNNEIDYYISEFETRSRKCHWNIACIEATLLFNTTTHLIIRTQEVEVRCSIDEQQDDERMLFETHEATWYNMIIGIESLIIDEDIEMRLLNKLLGIVLLPDWLPQLKHLSTTITRLIGAAIIPTTDTKIKEERQVVLRYSIAAFHCVVSSLPLPAFLKHREAEQLSSLLFDAAGSVLPIHDIKSTNKVEAIKLKTEDKDLLIDLFDSFCLVTPIRENVTTGKTDCPKINRHLGKLHRWYDTLVCVLLSIEKGSDNSKDLLVIYHSLRAMASIDSAHCTSTGNVLLIVNCVRAWWWSVAVLTQGMSVLAQCLTAHPKLATQEPVILNFSFETCQRLHFSMIYTNKLSGLYSGVLRLLCVLATVSPFIKESMNEHYVLSFVDASLRHFPREPVTVEYSLHLLVMLSTSLSLRLAMARCGLAEVISKVVHDRFVGAKSISKAVFLLDLLHKTGAVLP